MSKKVAIGVIVFVLAAVAVWLLTGKGEEPFRPVTPSEIDDPAQLDELHLYRIVPYRGQALGS
jgi:hypothetical protein